MRCWSNSCWTNPSSR